ncbi:hypothetical protein SynMITS9220_02335 [Synechococcus sp. MIT S9220]|jgi:hypothetical protein|nr:hypothetical protein SynMITS9220_02335 [Synechococcus sp. MIT S9220]
MSIGKDTSILTPDCNPGKDYVEVLSLDSISMLVRSGTESQKE